MRLERKPRMDDGTLGVVAPVKENEESSVQKMVRLEQEAAYLAYSDVQKDLRIQELEASHGLLAYQLMQGGII